MAIQSQLPGQIVEVIGLSSVSGIAQQPATLANLSLGNLVQNVNLSQQNTVSNQHNVNGLQQTLLSKTVNLLTSLGPLEAMSTQQLLTGNAVAREVSALRAAVAPLLGPARVRRREGLPGQSPGNPIRDWRKVYLRPSRNIDVVVENT